MTVRDDPSGLLTGAMDRNIEYGQTLEDVMRRARVLDLSAIDRFRRWQADCVSVLSDGFELEAAGEFLRATGGVSQASSAADLRRSARRVGDGVALLRALRSTLQAGRPGEDGLSRTLARAR